MLEQARPREETGRIPAAAAAVPDRAAAPRLRVAYLLWRYPEISLTFVQREVAGLRARGVEVHTLAIRPAHAATLLTETERESARTTWTVLPARPLPVLLAHLRVLLTRPGGYLAALRLATAEGAPRQRLRGAFYFAEAVVVAARLRRLGVDHLHVHGGDVGSTVARLVAALERGASGRRRPFTWSLTVHGPGELLDARGHGLLEKIDDADLVVAISEYGRAQMLALTDPRNWPKVEVVHCGIDVEGWPRREAAPGSGPLRVLTVARLHPQKSHEVLVEAVDLLRGRGVAVDVTLVGDGERRARLEAEVVRRGLTDRIHFLGALGQSDAREQFRHHDVFCLPSVSEGLPVVLMEAMAAGLPVVTTRITGVPELVVDGESGLLVPPGRPEQLAAALERLVVEPELRERLAVGGLAAVRRGFDVRHTAAELEAHFRALLTAG